MRKRAFHVAAAIIPFIMMLTPLAVAEWAGPITAHVPFEFTIGGKALPPGDYTVDVAGGTSPNALVISSKDGSEKVLFDTNQLPAKDDPNVIELVFEDLGGMVYLTEVWGAESSGRAVRNMVDGKMIQLASSPARRRVPATRVVNGGAQK